MQIAKVMGTAISQTKHDSLHGLKLLLVQIYLPDGSGSDGYPLLAMDTYGARVGDEVIVTSDSEMTKSVASAERTPLRWAVLGIKD